MAVLGKALGWPILAEAASGLRCGRHDQTQVIATADALLRHAPTSQALAPSFVLCLGQAPTSKATRAWLSQAPRVALVDPDGQWHEPDTRAQEIVIADPIVLCRALGEALDACDISPEGRDWLDRWIQAEARAERVLQDHALDGVWEGAVSSRMLPALPEGSQVHVASSLAVRALDGFGGKTSRTIGIRANRGCNGIDGTLATALGSSLACRVPTLVLLGDLAFLHDLGGFEAACQLEAPLTVVVVHNGGGGIFDHLPISQHPTAFEKYFVTGRKASIAALCSAMGSRHQYVEDPRQLGVVLGEELEKGQPSVIEVRVDRSESLSRHQNAWDDVARTMESSGVLFEKGGQS